MNRRTFLKISGMGSISLAAGCSGEAEKSLFSMTRTPDDIISGKANWYASTCRECPAGCGILAKNREGRLIKIEGNPLHPINKGKLCIRGQAALQGIYNPDRIKTPLIRKNEKWKPISFEDAKEILKTRANHAARQGPNRVRMLTEVIGQSLMRLSKKSLQEWNSREILVFEPFGYESLKKANRRIFGVDGLVSYHMERADLLVSFGADFLETWLSPVEYAWKFKAMHGIKKNRKGLFFHISPYQSLTGANADHWLLCHPDAEAVVAFGLVRETLLSGRGKHLPEPLIQSLQKITALFTRKKVTEMSSISTTLYEKMISSVLAARYPLILGTGSCPSGRNILQTDMSVNLLNWILDPDLTLLDFTNRHRVEIAAGRNELLDFFNTMQNDKSGVLLIHNANPVFTLPTEIRIREKLASEALYVISFSNFMDETSQLANLIFPVRFPLETWDEYSGWTSIISTLQPAIGKITEAPHFGDVLLNAAFEINRPAKNFKTYLKRQLQLQGHPFTENDWVKTLQTGGIFKPPTISRAAKVKKPPLSLSIPLISVSPIDLRFAAVPSIRFFDGRGANKSWLCEIPDPLTKVAWQTVVMVHPQLLKQKRLTDGDVMEITSKSGRMEAPVYETENIHPAMLLMSIGQGHETYGRYASGKGLNPLLLLSPDSDPITGMPEFYGSVNIRKTGHRVELAHTDGSRFTHGRKIALSIDLIELQRQERHPSSTKKQGFSMDHFPLTLPIAEGYDPKRDFYPPHEHKDYRWAMVVDLDRCIGCAACAAACYAENNLGVVGVDRLIEGREMAWLSIERFHDPDHMWNITFLPMLCQQCDNAPCEPVCPVFAPHHSKEGLNNQIYNRCIGTRFCSQNCPYKVRRFNWFEWEWPAPLDMQLNPDVTVRSKGVMEKCSFCVQRIKEAHGAAKDENRRIHDGEVSPACVQTCPTGALVFGDLKDKKNRVRKLTEDPRAYQVMGYLNTKPAVIYLKKVIRQV